MLVHNTCKPFQYKARHRIINLPCSQDNISKSWIIPDQKPWIYRYTMPSYTRPWRQYIYPWVHISNLNYLIYIQPCLMTKFHQFICKRYIDVTICILYYLCHLCRSYISNNNFPFAESPINLLYYFSDFPVICSYRP